MKQPAVYILTNRRTGTLYIGVTSDLIKRVYQHKNDFIEGFSKQHNTHLLVYYELHGSMESAITREKQMKEWQRAWKIKLIEEMNPYWNDLYQNII